MQPDPQDIDERLAELDDLPVEEHLPIYEAVHQDLTAALADSAADPAADPAANEPVDDSAAAGADEGAGDAGS